MPRVIDPTIWRDRFIRSLPFMQRVLWLGLIVTCADDQGRLENDVFLIRSDVFPADNVREQDIEDALLEFGNARKLLAYEADGKHFLQILNWWKYQKKALFMRIMAQSMSHPLTLL